MTTRRAILALAFLLLLGSLASAGKAKGDKVAKKFGGKVVLSEKRFPMAAKSPAAYIAKVKKQSKAKFWEDKANKRWKIHFAAFFKKPLPDLEYQLKVYDITGNQKSVMLAFDQYADSSGMMSLISDITLERDSVGVNKQCLITVEVGGRVMASGTFQILGEAEKFDGKVDFGGDANSEDE